MPLIRPSAGQQIASAHIDQLVDLLTAGTNGPIASAALPVATLAAIGGAHLLEYDAVALGLVPDGGVSDQTSTFNAALQTAAGGTLVLPSGKIKCLGQIVNPANGGAGAQTLRIRGQGTTRSGSGGGPNGGTILDLRYAGTDAKLLTTSYGCLEIDGVTFTDGGADTLPFIKTTRTALLIHDNEFQGTGTGASTLQDAIILGGTENVIDATSNSQFVGYGTVIRENYFNHVQRAVLLQTYANSVVIVFNTIWSGGGGVAAIDYEPVLTGDINAGGLCLGNLIEMTNYTYGIRLKTTQFVSLIANGLHDWGVGVSLAGYRFESDAPNNLLIPGSFNYTHTLADDQSGANTILSAASARGSTFPAGATFLGPAGGLGTALNVTTNATNNQGIAIQAAVAAAAAMGSYPLIITDSAGHKVMQIGRDTAGRLNPAILASSPGDVGGAMALYLSGYGAPGLALNSDTSEQVLVGNGAATGPALNVNGQVSHKGAAPAYIGKSANYTLTLTDSTVALTASSVTITLPPANTVPVGRMYVLKNTSGVTGTIIAPNGTDTIEGATGNNTTALAGALAAARLLCTGTNAWFLV